MAKQLFLADIDLGKNQLINARLENLATAPSVYAPISDADPLKNKDIGLVYWNTTDKTAYFLADYTPITFTPIWKSLGSGAGAGTFSSDITFSIAANKTLGKYVGGTTQVIPAAGKTFEAVLKDIALESIPPTTTLTITSQQPEYNSTDIVNVLSFSYVLKTPGASVSVGYPKLEFSRGNSNSWVELDASSSPFTHTNLTVSDKISSFNYRYTVVDSNGSNSTSNATTTPMPYSGPILDSVQNDSKELGDILYNKSHSVTKASPNTSLTDWVIMVQLNSGTKIQIGDYSDFTSNPSISISSGGTVNGVVVPGILSATRIDVYVRIRDSVTSVDRLSLGRSFYQNKFYGSSTIAVSNFRTLNPTSASSIPSYNPYPGKYMYVALPAGLTLKSVKTSNNNEVTSNFILSSVSIPDAGGVNRTYNLYTWVASVSFESSVTLYTVIQ